MFYISAMKSVVFFVDYVVSINYLDEFIVEYK